MDEIETELVVERRVDRMGAGDQEECIAIRRRTYDRLFPGPARQLHAQIL